MKKYILLVAGYEYQNGGTFVQSAEQRRQNLLDLHPDWRNDPEVVFVKFDVKSGRIERNNSTPGAGSWVLETQSNDAVNRRNHYTESHLKQQENNLMSITTIYQYVINLGASEPGSLFELSLIGHGWFGGPILLNSFQRSEFTSGDTANTRDPWDRDGRTKDFLPQNMPEEDWKNFRAAFAPDGYAWVWGCLFPRAYFDTLYKFFQTREFKSKPMSDLVDSDTFTITVNGTFVNEYYDVDRAFFPTDNSQITFTRSLADLKGYVKRGIRRTYPGRFVGDTAIKCIAGYLGTYSDYERSYTGHYAPHPVMIIPRNSTVYGADFSNIINFYKIHVGIEEDPESRGYAIYTIDKINEFWTA